MGNDKLIITNAEALQQELDQRDLQEWEHLALRMSQIQERLWRRGLIKRPKVLSNRQWDKLEEAIGHKTLETILRS